MNNLARTYARALLRALEGKSEKQSNEIIARFAKLLKKRRHTGITSSVLKQITRMRERENAKKTVRVVSAIPISEKLRSELRKRFAGTAHAFSVNPALLGGLVVQNGTRLYQNTLKRNSEELWK